MSSGEAPPSARVTPATPWKSKALSSVFWVELSKARASSCCFQSVMSVERSPPVGATFPPNATPKMSPAYDCTVTPVGVRDHGPLPLRVKMLSPFDHIQRGQAAVRLIGVPFGLCHGA